MTANIMAAAEELTDAAYAYKPTATVRTLGQLIGHVAGTQKLICAAVLGDQRPAEDAIVKRATPKGLHLLAGTARHRNSRCGGCFHVGRTSVDGGR